MKKSSLIGHVLEVYERILNAAQPADRIVKRFFHHRRYLGASDRRFISETVFGMLRHDRLLNILSQRASSPSWFVPGSGKGHHVLMLYATYAVTILQQSALSVTEDLTSLRDRSYPGLDIAGFVQALTLIDASQKLSKRLEEELAHRYSFPEFIVQEWLETYGAEETERLCAALNLPAPTTMRVNTLRTTVDQCRQTLQQERVISERTLFSPVGITIPSRVSMHDLLAFRKGFFEMQDEGSQLVSFLLQPRPGQTVLDACAGSGGKSLHLATLMQNQGTIYAFDVEQARLRDILTRSERAGISIVHPLVGSHERGGPMTAGAFDSVLIDAPCSGTGTFRRNPGAKRTLTPQLVNECAERQKAILQSFAQLVRPGGRLVYATCSLLRQENEEVMEWFLRSHPEYSIVSAGEVLSRSGIDMLFPTPFMKLLPHRHGTDGFFAAAMDRAVGLR